MDWCILFALARESRPFLRRFPERQRIAVGKLRAWKCREGLHVVETGIGRERSAHALRELLTSGFLNGCGVVSAGFAGALAEGWRAGDVVLADEVCDEQGRSWPAAPHLAGRRGRLLTVSRLVGDPVEKRRLGQSHHAVAVDMEAAVVAEFCAEHGLPFQALRVISDDVTTGLSPELVRLLGGATVSPVRLLRAAVRSPRVVGQLCRLAAATRMGARNLAGALVAWAAGPC